MLKLVLITVLVAGVLTSVAVAAPTASRAGSSCPSLLPTADPSLRPGATQTLVPPGARTLLVCSYHGLNPPALARRLERVGHLDGGSELATIVSEFDSLRASQGLSGCPMDDGSAILAVFGYPTEPSSPVTVGLTGCRIVANGHLSRTASLPPGPALLGRLNAILG